MSSFCLQDFLLCPWNIFIKLDMNGGAMGPYSLSPASLPCYRHGSQHAKLHRGWLTLLCQHTCRDVARRAFFLSGIWVFMPMLWVVLSYLKWFWFCVGGQICTKMHVLSVTQKPHPATCTVSEVCAPSLFPQVVVPVLRLCTPNKVNIPHVACPEVEYCTLKRSIFWSDWQFTPAPQIPSLPCQGGAKFSRVSQKPSDHLLPGN